MEVVMAVVILAFVVTSVLTVMNQCIAAASDSRTRTEAFEIARENMESLLAADKVSEKTEFGMSETNPDIQWETVIETFTEPVTSTMWLRAVCSASYTDKDGEIRSVELTNWLTNVSSAIQNKIKMQKQKEKELMEKEDGDGDDRDGDGVLDADDNCPGTPNPGQEDSDGNGTGDACENGGDYDGDGIPDNEDNCPTTYNPGQEDSNDNQGGDACDDIYCGKTIGEIAGMKADKRGQFIDNCDEL